MNIGEAVQALKLGHKVTRKNWNGKDMYLMHVEGSINDAGQTCRDCVVMKTVDNQVVPWTCSQSDLLENDWEIVE